MLEGTSDCSKLLSKIGAKCVDILAAPLDETLCELVRLELDTTSSDCTEERRSLKDGSIRRL